MIALITFALAATPEQLDAAATEARAQLARCAAEGCTAADGARAAWLLAVQRYVATGEADAELAATVRALDTKLFADLPPVLRATEAEAPTWTADLAPEGDQISFTINRKRNGKWKTSWKSVTLRVTNQDGDPLPTAFVRLPGDPSQHRVNTVTGQWTDSAQRVDAHTLDPFEPGDELSFDIVAPGYRTTRIHMIVPKRKDGYAPVFLTPWQPTWTDDALAVPAHAAYDGWVHAHTASVTSPSEASYAAAERAASVSAETARAWWRATDNADAHAICLQTARLPDFCQ